MALTKTSVNLLLLLGILSLTLATPDQTSELEKSNENGDTQDVPVAAEKPDRPSPTELDVAHENGAVQFRTCFFKYYTCRRRFFPRCVKACNFQFFVCKRRRQRGVEETIQYALNAPKQPAEFEEENENGNVQYRYRRFICNRIYRRCAYQFRYFCRKVCAYNYQQCIRGIQE